MGQARLRAGELLWLVGLGEEGNSRQLQGMARGRQVPAEDSFKGSSELAKWKCRCLAQPQACPRMVGSAEKCHASHVAGSHWATACEKTGTAGGSHWRHGALAF